jgi:general secretion pathway protein M
MRTTFLRKLASRCGVLAILLALILSLKSFVIDPALGSLHQSDEAISAAQDQLSRLRTIAAESPRLIEMENALRQQLEHSPVFLRGNTEALVGAALQEKLRGLVGSQGAAVSAIQWSAAKSTDGFSRVAVKLQMTASIRTLYLLLASVETATPLLIVDDLDVQAQATGTDPASASRDVTLAVSFECYGYWSADGASLGKVGP